MPEQRPNEPRVTPSKPSRPPDPVDEAGFESFPASDPPSWTPTHVGSPKPRERKRRPRR